MFEKYLALNPEFLKELKQDYNLYCMWRTEHSLIDPDIDPVHNPDWRASQCKLEQKQLQELKELRTAYKADFDKSHQKVINEVRAFLEKTKADGGYCIRDASTGVELPDAYVANAYGNRNVMEHRRLLVALLDELEQ